MEEKTHIMREDSCQALVNAAYDALLLVDSEYRVVSMNVAAVNMFGESAGEHPNLAAWTNSPELEILVADALLNADEAFEEQLSIGDKPHRARIAVVRQGDELFVALVLQDVSQLVRLNRARRDMVANISHELRTPIANIRLILDGLFQDVEKPKRKNSISALRAIGRETDSLLWIMQEILDLSMIESGQAILRMVEVPLAQLVEETFERMFDQSAAKSLTLEHNIPRDLQALCDPDQARRVFINLTHNAVKWSPKGEVIHIHAEPGDYVTICVRDHGPGVPDEQRERIFERFYQVDASRSGNEGTGLGLAICKHIVEAHGGRIWVEGGPGQGGCFMFTLPGSDNKQDIHL